jgi:hypothetical protein
MMFAVANGRGGIMSIPEVVAVISAVATSLGIIEKLCHYEQSFLKKSLQNPNLQSLSLNFWIFRV